MRKSARPAYPASSIYWIDAATGGRRKKALDKPTVDNALVTMLQQAMFGVEQETWVVDDSGSVVKVQERHPDLAHPAKAPSLKGEVDDRPVWEMSSAQVEIATKPERDISLGGVRGAVDKVFADAYTHMKRSNAAWFFGPIALVGAPGRVRDARYDKYQRKFGSTSTESAIQVGSTQINVRTVDPDAPIDGETKAVCLELGSRVASMAADSAARRIALTASSPIMWTNYGRGIKHVHDRIAGDGEANLVCTQRMASRNAVFAGVISRRVPDAFYSVKQYAQSRGAALERLGLRNTKKNFGFDHSLLRWRDWGGWEERDSDPTPTKSELALLIIDSISDFLVNSQKLANNPHHIQADVGSRRWAMEHAEITGYRGSRCPPNERDELRDAKTHSSEEITAAIRTHYLKAKPLFEAFERGDFHGVLVPEAPVSVTDWESAASSSKMWMQAKQTLDFLFTFGGSAQRQIDALEWYRQRPENRTRMALSWADGVDVLAKDEALFVQCFLMAENELDLTIARDKVHNRALDLQSKAMTGGLAGAIRPPRSEWSLAG